MLQLQQQTPQLRNLAAAARAPVNRRLSTLASVPATPSEPATPAPPPSGSATPAIATRPSENSLSNDPLFSMSKPTPSIPDRAEIDALLAIPPVPYSQSFAAPPAPGGPPQRYFCDNCGYWGKIRCLKCGSRVCGLECKDAHEGTRCLKWA